MSISQVISLLSGVALFLFGMSLMGEGLKQVSGNNEKKNGKPKDKKAVLGQPVKRENPNRSNIQQGKREDRSRNEKNTDQKEKNEKETIKSSNNTSPWADAVEKAMKAINHDN